MDFYWYFFKNKIIRSAGVVLHELVNLKRPFELDTDDNDEFAEIREIINYEKPVPFNNLNVNTPEYLKELMKKYLNVYKIISISSENFNLK